MNALLPKYVEHLKARIRARSNTPTATDKEQGLATLPESVSQLCANDPQECLALIVAALREASSPHLVQAIGDGLLDTLLNSHADRLGDQVAALLRSDERFRFAYASSSHASVDPAVISEWVEVLKSLGTTKQAQRKRLWATRLK